MFSGPQVGEKLPSLKVKGVFGDLAAKELDLVERADGKPVALVFFHARTRPAFGLTNTVMRYVASRSADGLTGGVIFLTDDPTSTENWLQIVERHFSKEIVYGISMDGLEGPGSYGLNRNVTLTVLVGKEGKVTANFALVQPSQQADGPKILKAIVDASGGGRVPTIAELGGARYTGQARMMRGASDARLSSLVRAVINKEASEADVKTAVAAVEKYVAENKSARDELGQIAGRVVNSGRLSNYGNAAAQQAIRQWAQKYGKAPEGRQKKRDQ